MNFLDIKTDFAFKKVFGSEESKELLIDFLNAVITFENGHKIKSLTIVDPYNIPMLKGMKDTYTEKELKSIQDKWLYFIKNAGSLEYVPKNQSKEIEKAYQIANEANFSKEELDIQHRKRDWVYIQKSSIELALKTGKVEGEIEATKKMVLSMAKKGIAIEIIADITGLTLGKVMLIIEGENG